MDSLTITEEGKVLSPDGELKQHKAQSGYWTVNYGGRTYYVHRLVAQAYLPNPENKPQVAHIDGTRTNNCVENLKWATQAENEADKIRHGRSNKGSRNGQAKLTEADVTQIRKYRADGMHVDAVAELFGVSRWTIYDACNPKRTWRAEK